MMRLGNKGQSLVLFILIFPVMLFVMVLVIDCGRVMIEKKELDNVSKIVIQYGFDHITEEDVEDKMVSLFELNVDDVDVNVNVCEDMIDVSGVKYVDGVFSSIIHMNGFKIESNYSGIVIDNKVSIKEN